MIRKLCVLLDSRSIYLSLAEILNHVPQLEFVSHMVLIDILSLFFVLTILCQFYKINLTVATTIMQALIQLSNHYLLFPSFLIPTGANIEFDSVDGP